MNCMPTHHTFPTTSILTLALILFILTPFLYAAEKPECENQVLPLPPVSSCQNLINTIHKLSLREPYIYHWSRHPDTKESYTALLPRTFIDNRKPQDYTYICSITVDVIPEHEKDGEDSFGYLDIARAANEISKVCLKRERGIRPQVGWMGVGFLEQPQVVGVRMGSLRRMDGGKWWDGRRVVEIVDGSDGEVREVETA